MSSDSMVYLTIIRTEIEVRGLEVLEGGLKGLNWLPVIGIVQFSDKEDILAGNTRCLDTLADFSLIS